MNILELYSGIGGMHLALKESGINGKIVAAVEISTVANSVYFHNFPDTLLLNRNIQGLTAQFINKLNVDAIFMSPPCQPFTRNGLKKDEVDSRSCSFSHILSILSDLNVKYILIENVKGFETSLMRNKLLDTLKNCQFAFQEFILSPTQFGVSNTRHRYYLLAKKLPLKFIFPVGQLKEQLPNTECRQNLFTMAEIIEDNKNISDYLLSDNILLKYSRILDICNLQSKRSCCFTKAYGKYVEGTGSVFTAKTQEEINSVYKELSEGNLCEKDFVNCVNKLELRFFTPKEVARLMSFPETFIFPNDITIKQRYKLLGNSINVKVVSKLIVLLAKN